VLPLGLGHPEHVVEEELLGVGRGEAGVFEPWAVHHDLVQAAHFGMDTECHV
jgi:hypothetical protein